MIISPNFVLIVYVYWKGGQSLATQQVVPSSKWYPLEPGTEWYRLLWWHCIPKEAFNKSYELAFKISHNIASNGISIKDCMKFC